MRKAMMREEIYVLRVYLWVSKIVFHIILPTTTKISGSCNLWRNGASGLWYILGPGYEWVLWNYPRPVLPSLCVIIKYQICNMSNRWSDKEGMFGVGMTRWCLWKYWHGGILWWGVWTGHSGSKARFRGHDAYSGFTCFHAFLSIFCLWFLRSSEF